MSTIVKGDKQYFTVLFSPRKSDLLPKSVATADFHLTWPIDWVTDVEPAQACRANSLILTKIIGYFKRLDKCAALEPLIICSSAVVQIQILQTMKTKIFSFVLYKGWGGGGNIWCLWKQWPQTLMRLLNQIFQLHVAKAWKAGCGLNIPPLTITRGGNWPQRASSQAWQNDTRPTPIALLRVCQWRPSSKWEISEEVGKWASAQQPSQ